LSIIPPRIEKYNGMELRIIVKERRKEATLILDYNYKKPEIIVLGVYSSIMHVKK